MLVFAAWCGMLFGALEGAALFVVRYFLVSLDPYKTSPHVLWVSPLFDIFVCLAATGLSLWGLRLFARWWSVDLRRLVYLVPVFSGAFGLFNALRLMHPMAAVLLSAALAAGLRPFWYHLAMRLAEGHMIRRLALIPMMLLALASGVFGARAAATQIRLAALPPPDENALNVIVMVLDTVRRDSFDARLSPVSLTPNLDRLSRRATWFDDAWSTTSWSLPSQASLLTGLSPNQHGADWPTLKLLPDVPTLPEIFEQRGYVTGAFSGNAVWITPEYLGRGFLEFKVYSAENHIRRTSYGRVLSRVLDLLGAHRAGRGRKAADLNRDLEAFVSRAGDRPFFAYVCYMDVNQTFHHRRLNHPPWRQYPPEGEVYEAYLAGLRRLDDQIGRLLDALDRRGALKRTLVVVVSDHGESFGDTVGFDHEPAGHGTSLYVEQARVPLFFVEPGESADARTITETVSIQSVPYRLAGILGWSDVPFPAPPSGAALATLRYDDRQQRSVAAGKWHYIEDALAEPKQQLFDLAADPHESRNLASERPIPGVVEPWLRVGLTTSDLR